MNMFIIKKAVRAMAVLALGSTVSAALGMGYFGLFYPGPGEDDRVTEYERAYLRREALQCGAAAGAIVGLAGGLVGLKAAEKGRPLRRAALFGALSLLPAFLLFVISPYTMAWALFMTPLSLVAGGLSGFLAGLLGTRRGLTSGGLGRRI